MASLVNTATVTPGFSNQIEWARATYDFAADAGATGTLTIFTATTAIVVVHAWAVIKAACTSAGSATVNWGPSGDDDRFMNITQGAVASLTLGAIVLPLALEGTPNVIATPYTVAAAGVIHMDIATADLTAGKIEFVIGYMKP